MNKEKINMKQENKEKLLARRKAYYAENKEKLLARRKAYYAENKEKMLARHIDRLDPEKGYTKKNIVFCGWDVNRRKKAYYVDHIIPLRGEKI